MEVLSMPRAPSTEQLAKSALRIATELSKHVPADRRSAPSASLDRRERRHADGLAKVARVVAELRTQVAELTDRVDQIAQQLDQTPRRRSR
jgi:hypothetical protein